MKPLTHTLDIPGCTLEIWESLRNDPEWDPWCAGQEGQTFELISQEETDGLVLREHHSTGKVNPLPKAVRQIVGDINPINVCRCKWWKHQHDQQHPMTQEAEVIKPKSLVGRIKVSITQWAEALDDGGAQRGLRVHTTFDVSIRVKVVGSLIAKTLVQRLMASLSGLARNIVDYLRASGDASRAQLAEQLAVHLGRSPKQPEPPPVDADEMEAMEDEAVEEDQAQEAQAEATEAAESAEATEAAVSAEAAAEAARSPETSLQERMKHIREKRLAIMQAPAAEEVCLGPEDQALPRALLGAASSKDAAAAGEASDGAAGGATAERREAAVADGEAKANDEEGSFSKTWSVSSAVSSASSAVSSSSSYAYLSESPTSATDPAELEDERGGGTDAAAADDSAVDAGGGASVAVPKGFEFGSFDRPTSACTLMNAPAPPRSEALQAIMRLQALGNASEVRSWASNAADDELLALTKGLRMVNASWLHADAAAINMEIELAILRQAGMAMSVDAKTEFQSLSAQLACLTERCIKSEQARIAAEAKLAEKCDEVDSLTGALQHAILGQKGAVEASRRSSMGTPKVKGTPIKKRP